MSYALQPLALAVVSVRVFCAVAICVHTTELLFCLVFSKNFNIMSALSAHQLPTTPQKTILAEVCFVAKRGEL